ncbi:MAG: hypothetical protein COW85_15430 [Ignavibacteria bacterium CG22_combo_CG10-13_8_21_14_all_37_15]|nr:MAG: hypothetical protein COW85_15430 [Ignavibacteria bacterium CG22_combo_CG10-13_8_21_14_all_37_15]PIQ10441.1 MAG: hypothetical protein COW71_02770 [Ignavibacteriales bacterium CG18_big_fil_WC_8_21_14_2_50_31_20]
MIVLSKVQLGFIKDIKNNEVTDAASFIHKYCRIKEIVLRNDEHFLNYTFSRGETAFVLVENKLAADLIFEFIDLCLKLEKEKLIVAASNAPNKIFPLFEEKKPLGEHSPAKVYFPDESVLPIIHLFNKKIYPTSEILKLKKKVYRNRNDKYYNRSLIVAWAGFILAFIVGLANIFNLFNTKKIELKNKINKGDTISVKIIPNDSTSLYTLIEKAQNESKINKANNHNRTNIK